MLDEKCDLAAADKEEPGAIMCSTKLPTWERDFIFYLKQKDGMMDQMEGVDQHLLKWFKSQTEHNDQKQKRKERIALYALWSTVTSAMEATRMLDKMELESQDCGDVDDIVADPDVQVFSRQLHYLQKKPNPLSLDVLHKGLA